jgi:hypothetical protein
MGSCDCYGNGRILIDRYCLAVRRWTIVPAHSTTYTIAVYQQERQNEEYQWDWFPHDSTRPENRYCISHFWMWIDKRGFMVSAIRVRHQRKDG